MNKIHIEDDLLIKSDIRNIAAIEKLIDNQSSLCNLNDEIYGKLLLAVVEGVNNAIVHGNKSDISKVVKIHYVIDNDTIVYEIKDAGSGFDPDSVPDPTTVENLDKPCGRGIFLMKHLADQIEFSCGGTCVKLKFNLK